MLRKGQIIALNACYFSCDNSAVLPLHWRGTKTNNGNENKLIHSIISDEERREDETLARLQQSLVLQSV
jgi:hypothetical protein